MTNSTDWLSSPPVRTRKLRRNLKTFRDNLAYEQGSGGVCLVTVRDALSYDVSTLLAIVVESSSGKAYTAALHDELTADCLPRTTVRDYCLGRVVGSFFTLAMLVTLCCEYCSLRNISIPPLKSSNPEIKREILWLLSQAHSRLVSLL